MAASPALPGVKSLHVATTSVDARLAAQSGGESPITHLAVQTMQAEVGASSVRRRITPEAGYALEILGHAIEYLADQYVHEFGLQAVPSGDSNSIDPQVEAMQLLMAANRQVYFECPVAMPLYRRLLRRLFPR